jgi:hypothetical protein
MLTSNKGEDVRIMFSDDVQDLEGVINIGSEAGGDTYGVWIEGGKLLAQTGLEAHV